MEDTFAALADSSRRRAVEQLRSGPCRAGELAERLELSAPAMSRHLRILRESGLVERDFDQADARATVYRLKPERFAELRSWLEHVEETWKGKLAAFAEYAERTRPRRR